MTVRIAVQALNLPNDQLAKMLGRYAEEKSSRHTPSVTTVKMVLVALSIRQRKRSDLGCDGEAVNESVPQIMAYWGLKKSTVDDALAFLTWSGVVRTIKKGGGKGRNPTIRQVNVDGFESGKREICDGESLLHYGDSDLLAGETFEQDGELPDTPLVQPLLKPVCDPTEFTVACEEGYEIENLLEAYLHEIERTVILGADMDTHPDESQQVDPARVSKAVTVDSRGAVDPKEACLRSVRAMASKYTVKSVYSIG